MYPRRRDLLALLAGSVAWPLLAQAQAAGSARRVGVLMAVTEDDGEATPRADALKAGLDAAGWTVGRNLQMDIRWGGAEDADKTRALATQLLDLKPDLIIANATPAAIAFLRLTKTVPIVFVLVSDPIGAGLVQSFSRPGGNITGYVNIEPSMVTKWVELLLEMDRSLTRTMMMFNPDTAPNAGMFFMEPFVAAAGPAKLMSQAAMVRSDADIDAAIAAFAAGGRGAVVVPPDTFNTAHRATILAAVDRAKLPAIYPYRYFATAGGLMSYGIDTIDVFRQVGGYVARILAGANPGELPVQSPSKFDFVINAKTAQQLGLMVPDTLLARADAVIG